MADFECVLKIVLVGNAGVGKSALLQRYVEDTFSPDYLATIGVDFQLKTLEVDGLKIKLQMWDTSGQERFRSITNSYFRGAHGVMVVYDITNQESFQSNDFWLNFAESNSSANIPKMLVGCKSDRSDVRQVQHTEAQKFAEEKGLECIEASGKDGQNAEQAFISLVKRILSDPDIVDDLHGGRACQFSAPAPRLRRSTFCSVI